MENSFRSINALLGAAAIVLLAACGPTPASAQEVTLEGVHLDIANTAMDTSFPAGCSGEAPACVQAQEGNKILSVTFQPRDLPKGQMLAYKNLPAVSVTTQDGTPVQYTLYKYDNVAHTLMLGFEVPDNAVVAGLNWANSKGIPLQAAP